MTYNIRGHAAEKDPEHVAALAAVINGCGPDIACLQEVHCGTRRSRGDQAEELSSRTGLRMAFGRSCPMDGGDYGNAVLTSGEVTASEVIPLPGSGEARSMMRVDLVINEVPMSVFVTHLSAWGRFRRRERMEQIEAVADATSRSALPHLLAGDLNVSPRSHEIRALIAHGHLQPSDTMREPTFRFTRQRLDYIFCDRNWSVLNSRVARQGPSDHWPLVVELAMEKA